MSLPAIPHLMFKNHLSLIHSSQLKILGGALRINHINNNLPLPFIKAPFLEQALTFRANGQDLLKRPTQQTNFITCAVEDAQSGGCQFVYVVVGDVGAEGRTAYYALGRDCEQDYVVEAACDE
jgi:hypothetical protein